MASKNEEDSNLSSSSSSSGGVFIEGWEFMQTLGEGAYGE